MMSVGGLVTAPRNGHHQGKGERDNQERREITNPAVIEVKKKKKKKGPPLTASDSTKDVPVILLSRIAQGTWAF